MAKGELGLHPSVFVSTLFASWFNALLMVPIISYIHIHFVPMILIYIPSDRNNDLIHVKFVKFHDDSKTLDRDLDRN